MAAITAVTAPALRHGKTNPNPNTHKFSTTTAANNNSNNNSTTNTYYDSQSGLYLPIHNDTEIRVFLDLSRRRSRHTAEQEEKGDDVVSTFAIPQTLSKDRVARDAVADQIQHWVHTVGIQGVILPPLQFPRDLRNLQTLVAISQQQQQTNNNPFALLVATQDPHHTPTNSHGNHYDDVLNKFDYGIQEIVRNETTTTTRSSSSSSNTNTILSTIVPYQQQQPNTTTSRNAPNPTRDVLQRCVEQGVHTTLSLTAATFHDTTPMAFATILASLLDSLEKSGGSNAGSHGVSGGDYIRIAPSSSSSASSSSFTTDTETLVEICEELCYLDMAGATMKSRLLVDCFGPDDHTTTNTAATTATAAADLVEELMSAGINKYVIRHTNDIAWIEAIANEQGKTIVRLLQ